MASKYYNSSGKEVVTGEVALAADLNTINSAIDSGFQIVVTDIAAAETDAEDWADLAEQWAEEVEDTEVETGKYSALHHSAKAADSATAAASDAVDTASDAADTAADLVLTNADVVSTGNDATDTAADLVATNQDTIDTAADVVLTNADVVLTNADVVLTNADVVTTTNLVASVSNLNMIINGGFQIWQRGTNGGGGADYNSADRWWIDDFVSGAQELSSGIPAYMLCTADYGPASEVTSLGIRQGVELFSYNELKGKTFTLTYEILNSDSLHGFTQVRYVDEVGSDTNAVTVSALDNTHSNTAGTWTTVTKTFTISADAVPTSKALEVYIGLYDSSTILDDDTFGIRNVKLEASSTATAFYLPGIGEELIKCQRYFQIRSTSGVSEYDFAPTMSGSAFESGTGPYEYEAEL